MRLLQVNYEDNDQEDIKDISVKMTLNEAVALVNIAGQLNGYAQRKLNLGEGESLYDCLDSVMNMHFDDGAPNLHITLETLKDE